MGKYKFLLVIFGFYLSLVPPAKGTNDYFIGTDYIKITKDKEKEYTEFLDKESYRNFDMNSMINMFRFNTISNALLEEMIKNKPLNIKETKDYFDTNIASHITIQDYHDHLTSITKALEYYMNQDNLSAENFFKDRISSTSLQMAIPTVEIWKIQIKNYADEDNRTIKSNLLKMKNIRSTDELFNEIGPHYNFSAFRDRIKRQLYKQNNLNKENIIYKLKKSNQVSMHQFSTATNLEEEILKYALIKRVNRDVYGNDEERLKNFKSWLNNTEKMYINTFKELGIKNDQLDFSPIFP